MIQIVKEFKEFSFCQPVGILIGKSEIRNEVRFRGESSQSILITSENGSYIWFGITNDIYNTKIIKLVEGPHDLKKEELITIVNNFKLQMKPNPYIADFLVSYVDQKEFESPALMAIQIYQDRYFVLVFSKRGSNIREDDIVYVHGVWEIKLSEECRNKLFLK